MDSVKKRRSRSLDDLLDNDSMLVEELDETQSLENLSENMDKKDKFCCSSPTPSENPCENEVLEIMDNSINVKNGHFNNLNDDSGIQCSSSDNDSLIHINNKNNNQLTDNEDNISMSISVTSSEPRDEKSGKNKKFLNKYVSKVKKLMKK
jgi:hypothetical protein